MIANGAINIVAVAILLALMHSSIFGPPSLGYQHDAFPVGPADWVRKFNPPGEMYNNFGAGGYLIYRLYPERKVFWDGRLEVYDKIFARLSKGEGIRDIYPVDWAIDNYAQAGTNPYTKDQWALVDFDSTYALYIFRNGKASSLIPDNEYFTLGPFEPEAALRNINDYPQQVRDRVADEIERFLAENDTDYARSYASAVYLMLGGEYKERAREILVKGLSSNEYYPEYWHYTALLQMQDGDFSSAEKTLRSLLFWWPRSSKSKLLLGEVLSAKGDHAGAIKEIASVIRDGYSPPQAYYVLAKEYRSVGESAKATDALESYFKILPRRNETRRNISRQCRWQKI